MKTAWLYVVLAAGIFRLVSDACGEDPHALTAARQRYDGEIKSAQHRYLRDLRNLKSTYTQQGDLESAMTVKEEMDRVRLSAGLSVLIPENAVEWKEHFYWFPAQDLTYKDAMDLARERGGHLVIIDSEEENDFVTSHLKELYTWIGLHRKKFRDGNDWITVTGETPLFLKWDQSQGHGKNQPYAGIRDDGLWHDFFGSEEQRFIVEWE